MHSEPSRVATTGPLPGAGLSYRQPELHVPAAPASQEPLPGTAAMSLRPWWRTALALAALQLVVLYLPTLLWLWDRWTMSVWQNAHGVFIPPFVAYLVYKVLKARQFTAQPNVLGFALVIPALALHTLDTGMNTQLLSAASIVLLLPGLSLLVLGARATRAILLPLAFLSFALPIPLAFTEPIHWQLRQLVTASTVAALPFLGIPVLRAGTTLHLPNGVVQVADACSGFSTLYAALAVACLTAFGTSSTVRRGLVLAVAGPVAIVANVARVILLVALVEWRGSEVLQTFIHPLSGLLTFAVAIPVILWVGGDRDEAKP